MAFNWREALLNLLNGSIEEVGESKLEEALQKLRDKNPALYEATIKSGLAFANAVKPEVEESKSKVDDAILDGIIDALTDSAAANGLAI